MTRPIILSRSPDSIARRKGNRIEVEANSQGETPRCKGPESEVVSTR